MWLNPTSGTQATSHGRPVPSLLPPLLKVALIPCLPSSSLPLPWEKRKGARTLCLPRHGGQDRSRTYSGSCTSSVLIVSTPYRVLDVRPALGDFSPSLPVKRVPRPVAAGGDVAADTRGWAGLLGRPAGPCPSAECVPAASLANPPGRGFPPGALLRLRRPLAVSGAIRSCRGPARSDGGLPLAFSGTDETSCNGRGSPASPQSGNRLAGGVEDTGVRRPI